MVRIGFNARYLTHRTTGIERYLMNLIVHLQAIAPENEYILFCTDYYSSSMESPLQKGIIIDRSGSKLERGGIIGQLGKILWEQVTLPKRIKGMNLNVFHAPSFIAPIFSKACPTVVTIHDLAFLRYPEAFTRRTLLYFKAFLRKSLVMADIVIAVSQATAQDLISLLGVTSAKIRVIHHGLDGHFQRGMSSEESSRVYSKFGIHREFILNVSTLSPRKNVEGLIKALKLLIDEGHDIDLVISGGEGWKHSQIYTLAHRLGLDDRIIFTGFITDDDLKCLYHAAKIFVYPSLYEGFGLPVLEAMACGTPVVTSNVSALPEVAGDAALLVDPSKPEEIARAIARLLEDEHLREKLIHKGHERVKLFSWEKTALKTLEVYRSIIGD